MRNQILAAVLVAGALGAQSPLTTTFAGGNGLTASGSTNYFDLNVKLGIAVSQIDCNIWTGGISTSINVWSVPGTHVGNETNSGAWTLLGSATNPAPSPNGTPSPFIFTTPFALQPGMYGIAVEYVGDGMAYTNGTAAGALFASNNELDFFEGGSTGALFTATQFSPRVWNGAIHYNPLAGFATATSYGMGCAGTADYASAYESFPPGAFDLGGSPGNETVIQALNTGSGFAFLTGAPTWFTPVSPNLNLPDDGDSAALPLGFTFTTPSGHNTSNIIINSNGYVFLDSVVNNPLAFYFQHTVPDFVNGQPRIALCWVDLDPSAGTGSGSVHFDTAPGAAYVTFNGVQRFGFPAETMTVQLAIFAGGNFEIRYSTETISTGTGDPFMGYTPGNGALAPPESDFSVLPIFTRPDLVIPNLGLSSQRPVEGTTMAVTISDIPPGTVLGTLILSALKFDPGIQPLPGLGSCVQHVGLNDVFYYLPTGPSHVLNFAVPTGTFTGAIINAQAVTLSPGTNPVGIASSNGLEWVIDVN